MHPTPLPPPGWYLDPAGEKRLRLWTGGAWTEHTRPRPPAVRSQGSRKRRRTLVAGGIGLGIAVLAATGFPKLGGGGSPPSAAADAARSGAQPDRSVDCTLPGRRPSPRRVIGWLGANGVPAAAAADAPGQAPGGSCSVAAFTDPRARGANLVLAYPDTAGAASASLAQAGGPKVVFAEGIYVIALDPALRSARDQYQSKLARYVALTDPQVAVAPGSGSGLAAGSPAPDR